jgi:hypothetical protein
VGELVERTSDLHIFLRKNLRRRFENWTKTKEKDPSQGWDFFFGCPGAIELELIIRRIS